MKYSFLLLLICTSHLFAQSNSCESKIDTLTKLKVYNAERTASPKGGMQDFYKQIGEKLIFPRQFRDDDCPKIMFAFIIDETGKAIAVRLITKKYDGLESQLTKILDGITWVPATCNGSKVATFFILPIAIKCG